MENQKTLVASNVNAFDILRYIGALVAVVMFTSSALAMTIIPGLLNAFDPKFMWSDEQKEAYKAKIAAETAENN